MTNAAVVETGMDRFYRVLGEAVGAAVDKTPKSVRKDQRKMALVKQSTADLYRGIPHSQARWGHEAHAEGLRAFGMERSAKASAERKAKAHGDAKVAHAVAATQMQDHPEVVSFHRTAQQYHARKEREHSKAEDVTADKVATLAHSRVAQWRMAKLKDKLAAKKSISKSMSTAGATRVREGVASFEEATNQPLPDPVERASQLAFDTTEECEQPNATMEHNELAARLHYIAAGIARAYHEFHLADQHQTMVEQHRTRAKQLQIDEF